MLQRPAVRCKCAMRHFIVESHAYISCSKTGSHILEKILQKLGDEAPDADATTQTAVQQVIL